MHNFLIFKKLNKLKYLGFFLDFLPLYNSTYYTLSKIYCVVFSKSKLSATATFPGPEEGSENDDVLSVSINLIVCPILS